MGEIELITITEAARRGPISAFTLRRMKKQGTLPCFMCGRKAMVDYTKLLKLIDEKTGGSK